jgi:hypothetical protein
MKRIWQISVILLGLSIMASPARACLNDRETGYKEREFRSQYLSDSLSTEPEEAEGFWNLVQSHPNLMGALGGVMAIGGLALGVTIRSKAK